MASRKRHAPYSDEEEGRITTDEEEGEIEESHKRHKSHKKSKKHKKDKKHKKKHRRSHRSETPEGDDRGSTPEMEAGEVIDNTDEENNSRDKAHSSRSSSMARSRRQRSVTPPSKKRDSDDRSRSHGFSRGNSRSRTNSGESREKSFSPPPMQERDLKMPMKIQRSPSPSSSTQKGGNASVESLSIEETNKLRASLGLAPLKINQPKTEDKKENLKSDADKSLEGTAIPNSNVRHKPAENLTNKSATEKMRERLQQRKMKRLQESKLLTIGTLGAADDADDTAQWLKRQKKKEKEKKEAEKRAKMLAEMDDEFGVGNLVKEDVKKIRETAYGGQNLAGLTVEHDSSRFQDGKSVILTLKDSDVLGEDGDTLVNVNMMDDEKVEKNKEEIKKAKTGYNPYDQEEIDQVTGELRRKNMLDKYDTEIDGESKQSFVIGSHGTFNEEQERENARAKIRAKLASHTVESLQTPQMKLATDFYTDEEVIKFKKPKKKKKVKRKMLKADDLLNLNDDIKNEPLDRATKGGLPMDVDDDDVKPTFDDNELSRIKVDDDDRELQLALRKARKIKQKKRVIDNDDRAAALLQENGLTIKSEPDADDEIEGSTGAEFINTFADDKNFNSQFITINETSEFCRNLGAWQSHGGTGLGDKVPKEIQDFEDEMTDRSRSVKIAKSNIAKHKGSDSDEDPDNAMEGVSHPYFDEDSEDQKAMILDEEPDLKTGMAAAIKLASNKGYWETEARSQFGSKLKHLEAKSYTIEDKANDDRHSRRGGDRYGGGGGSTQSFQEKSDYKPNVRLEYIDDDGRMLDRKEAFRYLSHKFHGKGSGKLKTEKRQKKVMEESLMKNMSSTDTPLNTLGKLRQKQQDSATPYVILTGNKVQPANLKK